MTRVVPSADRLAAGVATAAAAAAIMLVGAAPSQAATIKVPSDVIVYGALEVEEGTAAILGQVFSPQRRCANRRRVEVTTRRDGRTRTWDVGPTSREGAFTRVGSLGAFNHFDQLSLLMTRRTFERGGNTYICKRVHLVEGGDAPTAAPARRAASDLRPIAVVGAGDDGEVTGFVDARRRQCLKGRTVRVFGVYDGERKELDVARTSLHGGWAGHLTLQESNDASKLVVSMKRKRFKRNGHRRTCSGDRISLQAEPARSLGVDPRGAWQS